MRIRSDGSVCISTNISHFSPANVGSLAALFPGIFYKVFGPRLTCLLAALMLFGGYFGAYLAIDGLLPNSYILMGLFFFLLGNGSSASYTAALTTNLGNYSQKYRGVVVGSMSAMYGISSALLSFFYAIVFRQKLLPMILFLSILTGAVPVVAAIFTNVAPPASSVDVKKSADDEAEQLFKEQDESYGSVAEKGPFQSINDQDEPMLKKEDVFQNVNSLQMMLTIDFWLVFFLYFAGVGSATTMINNLGSMVLSYGGKNGQQNPMVIVFSIANSLGRILSGLISDKFAAHFTRVTVLNVSVLSMGLVIYTFVFASVPAFYFGVIGTGLMLGSIFAMVPTYISERFGPDYFAINLSISCLAPSAGSYLLSALLASKIYEAHTRDGSTRCFGKACFQLTFIILTALCLLAFIVGLFLMYRSRRLYSRIYRFHRQQSTIQK